MSGKVQSVASAAAIIWHYKYKHVSGFSHCCRINMSDNHIGKRWFKSAQNYVWLNYVTQTKNRKWQNKNKCWLSLYNLAWWGLRKPKCVSAKFVTYKQPVVYKDWIRKEPKGSVRHVNIFKSKIHPWFQHNKMYNLQIKMKHKLASFDQIVGRQ